MGKRINPFTSSKAIGNVKAKGRSSAEIDSGTETLTAYNDAQPDNPSLDSYAQRIIDNDLPKTIDFYKRKQLPFLIRDVKKSLGLTRAQAQNIVVKLKL